MLLPTFAGSHAPDHLGAVLDGLLRVEGALGTGEALADHPGVLLIRILIRPALPLLDGLLRRPSGWSQQ
jgi:hypothetical protein